MGMGSTTEGENEAVEEKVNVKKLQAVIDGLSFRINEQQQMLENFHEQIRAIHGLYMTQQGQLDGYERQRIAELTLKVNGGSTFREDDGILVLSQYDYACLLAPVYNELVKPIIYRKDP